MYLSGIPLLSPWSSECCKLISGSSTFSKPSLDIWMLLVHVILKPNMQDFKYNLTSKRDECNCLMFRTFFSTVLLGNWDEDWPFPVLWPLLGLPDLLTYWTQHLDGIILKGFERLFSNSIASLGLLIKLALLTAVLPKAHLTSHYRMSGSGWLTTPLS